ncbi:methyltransferase domain-containing protein [Streptomyces silaceus]|uniref:methyltransferase domain-containing protein n=1 Tax=Streptomyces silaceus TaxID=545123 RepID=UPI00099EA243|nr:methyltransferase domain-containing protein [Streptomyces silaceus]
MTLLRDHDLARAFDHAARTYDLLTALNPGYRSDLYRSARRLRLPDDGAGLHVLDLGCGTGTSTRALLRAAPRAWITAVDASAGMLRRALDKPWPARVRFLHLTAEEVAAAESGPYDAVFAAYLFRNVADPDRVLTTVRSLLRPGGRLAVHEYSLSGSAVHRALWTAVCQGVIIPAGTLGGDRALYQHLWRSVLAFDTAPVFADRLVGRGFSDVRTVPVAGWQTGMVHTFLARSGAATDGSPRHGFPAGGAAFHGSAVNGSAVDGFPFSPSHGSTEPGR